MILINDKPTLKKHKRNLIKVLPKASRKDFIIGNFHKLRKVFVKKLSLLICLFVFNSFALEVTSYNIRNFDKKGKGTDKKELTNILQSLNSDIIAVQEIYNNRSFEKYVQKSLPEYKLILSRCGGGGQQNLGFLYNPEKVDFIKEVEDARIASPDDIVPQYGCASLRPAFLGFFKDRSTNKEFVAVVVHLKAGSGSRNYAKRWKQYDYLSKMIRSLRNARQKNIIILGDFNTTGYDHRDQDYNRFMQLLSKTGSDTASEEIACTSYWGGRNQNDDIELPSTLDHIVYSKNFMGLRLKSVEVGSHCKVAGCQEVYDSVLGRSYEAVSDHCPITASFE